MNKTKELRARQRAITNARAEASVIVLRHLLATLPADTALRVRMQALRDATDTGILEIVEETDWVSDPAK